MLTLCLWLVGLSVAFSAPVGVIPSNSGASFALLIICAALGLALYGKRAKLSWEEFLLICGAALLSISPFINSNRLVIQLSFMGWLAALTLLILRRAELGVPPETIFSFFRGMTQISLATLGMLFSSKTMRMLLPVRKGHHISFKEKISFSTILITLVLLSIFHLLFSLVNSEYAEFIDYVLRQIWHLITLIIDIELITKAVVFSLLFAALYRVISESAEINLQASIAGLRFVGILLPVIVIFGVFSVFQGKLLFLESALLTFKELSLYTQRGFWELLFAAFIGYGVWTYVTRRCQADGQNTWILRILLLVFNAELLLVAIFTAHKISLLQIFFGIKDTRVAATVAVVLIGATLVLNFLRQWVSDRKIFELQYRALGLVLLSAAFLNLEQIVTEFHPIRHKVIEQWQKDYAYLLGNSVDNYSSWRSLMQEARTTGIDYPSNYYWGQYRSICGGYDHPSPSLSGNNSFPIQTKWSRLIAKYKNAVDLRDINLREYAAAIYLEKHQQEVDEFNLFVREACENLRHKNN